MIGAAATFATDVRVIAEAVLEAGRRVLAAEATPTASAPVEPLQVPALDPPPTYTRVIERAQLDEIEILALRILVAAELDRSVHRMVRRLSAIETGSGTPVAGVITVIEALGGDPIEALRIFRAEESLVARGVVDLLEPGAQPLTQRVLIPARVIDFLVSGMTPDPVAPFALERPLPVESLCPMPLRDGSAKTDAAHELRQLFAAGIEHAPVWLVGPVASGRRTLFAALAREQGRRLLCVAHGELGLLTGNRLGALLWRETLFEESIVCVHDAEPEGSATSAPPPLGEDGTRKLTLDRGLVNVASMLAYTGLPIVFSSTQPPPIAAFEHPVRVVQLAQVRAQDALALWRRELPGVVDLATVAARFRLPPGQIVRAIDAARARAANHGRRVDASDVAKGIATGVSHQITVLGTLIEDEQTWEDIVLPAETLESIRELVARVRHRHQVLDQWGFREKMAKGLGLAALFHGAPGTGKTMVAGLIARELHQDLYQIDLSRMVSKWIGETEKNLARVFDAAEGANVMLLFDEADSMFSKRTEVKSSNDRHANAEVNYLLQRVERFEGVCILTTNLESSIDTAFKRRLAFRIEFPMPDERERKLLWTRMVPASAQIAPEVDYGVLAKRYELAGGNIRNAMLRAAFLAAEGRGPITMPLLLRAVELEYRDAGKLQASGSIYGR